MSDERLNPDSSKRGINIEIVDPEGIWEKIKGGTKKFFSEKNGFIVMGPELGNLGKSPLVRLVGESLTFKFDMQKNGNGYFYEGTPEENLQKHISVVSSDLMVDGVNVYRVSEGKKERIAYKNSDHHFIYEPGNVKVKTAEDFKHHLEQAALIYKAYAAAHYEEKNLPVPNDTLKFDPDYLERADKADSYNKSPLESVPNLLKGMLLVNKPDVRFEDVGGQEKAVATCRRFAEQLRYPEVFALEGSETPRGILLYGPSGTGKTLLAKAIANEADANFLHIKASDIVGEGLYGQSEHAVDSIFVQARKLAEDNGKHVIIFIDEGEMLLPGKESGSGSIHEATGKTIGIIAQEMDGIMEFKKITVIISTNNPNNLDFRILSRMDESEEVPLPDKNGLEQILRIHLDKLKKRAEIKIMDPEIDTTKLAEEAFSYSLSGRDIADIVGIIARQRGQKQLKMIKEAISSGRIVLQEGIGEKQLISSIASDIVRGDTENIADLVLPPFTTEDLLKVIQDSKNLLKSRPKGTFGFAKGSAQKNI